MSSAASSASCYLAVAPYSKTAKIYYGAADTCMAYAEIPIQEILDGLGSQ